MTCIRCELVRAKIIAMGMAGIGSSAEDILAKLVGMYGSDYYRTGNRVYRADPLGGPSIFVCEARR